MFCKVNENPIDGEQNGDYLTHILTHTNHTYFWPLYKSTSVSQYPQLRTGGFCWTKVLLPTCSCRWQLANLDYAEDGRVLLNGVTNTISIPYHMNS